MSTFSIPNSAGEIRTNYRSDKYGELWETFGVSLQSDGKIKSTRKLLKTKDVGDDGNFGDVVALATYASRHYAITSGGSDFEMYRCSVLDDPTVEANWIKFNSNGAFSDETDATVFGSLLLVSTENDILSTNGSINTTSYWTSTLSGATLTAGVPHVLKVLRGGQETLFVTDGNKVRYYNATAGHSTVTLQADLVASTMDRGSQSMWAGTHTESNDKALVYEIYVGEEIDAAPVARYAYEVDGRAVLWLKVVDGIPYVLTDKGHIQRFNGAGFVTVNSFPFAFTHESLEGVRAGAVDDNGQNRPVHHSGADVHNQSVYFLLNAEMYNEDKVPERCSSGVWEYDTINNRLNHRAALVETTTQNGFHLFEKSGPLMIINNPETLYLVGAELFGQANGLFTESNSYFGYITTTEIESQSVQDALQAQYIKAKTLTGDDNIKLKYRISKRDRQVVSGTWADAHTFNTADTVTVEAGDEFTLQEGTNAGAIAHVASVSVGAVVTSLTFTEALGVLGETDTAEITNFKLHSASYTSTDGEVKKYGLTDTNTWVQFKIVFNGEIEMRQFISKTNVKQEA